MRPYFKFTLPTLDIHSVERDIWNQADTVEVSQLYELLTNLRHDVGDARYRNNPRTTRERRLFYPHRVSG